MIDEFRETENLPISRFMAAAIARHGGLEGDEAELLTRIVTELTDALQRGHICIELTDQQRRVLRQSSVVDEDRQAPLVISGRRLYFGRYYGYESELSEALKALATQRSDLADGLEAFSGGPESGIDDPCQQRAIAIALNQRFCIISGGPGTGKTTLIVAIISQLLLSSGHDLRIALAAPTGKAAMRMQESIKTQLGGTAMEPSLADRFPDQAMTLHRLLRIGRRSSGLGIWEADPLGYDVVVVDEASMIDLAMMWRLVRSLKEGARLILLGDRDQLASVESGAVLADCIDSLPANVARLEKSYRFNKQIARFAEAVKTGDSDKALVLGSGSGDSEVSIAPADWLDRCIEGYRSYVALAAKIKDPARYNTVFREFNRFRVLCAVRKGSSGVEEINRRIERALSIDSPPVGSEQFYSGSPVIVTRNDYNLGLYNGDIGICLPDPDAGGALRLWFEGADGSLKKFLPGQIPLHDPAWALTIHKSQGSEFEEVVIVLPDIDSKILCRELLYTAVTRAREKIVLVVSEHILKLTVERKTVRYSGLADRLG